MSAGALPHPVSGVRFDSPAPPGAGWPGDPAGPDTPAARTSVEVARLAGGCATASELDPLVSVCRACPRLVSWREQVAGQKRAAFADEPYWGRPVPALGRDDVVVLIVGLAPAAHGGNRTGRMFTGDRSGDWLYAALHRAGYAAAPTSTSAGDGQELRGVRITAAVHCAPPANKPLPAERAACAGWLDRELELLGPGLRSMLALGSLAWDASLGAARRLKWAVPVPKPRFGHGAEVTLVSPGAHTLRLIGSYHVSQQNTFTGTLTQQMLDEVLARL